MVGVELVEDKSTKKPATEFAKAGRLELLEKGLLMHTCGHYGNAFRFMGPLTISESLLNTGLDIFESTIFQ